jgi:hypothetical protein
VDISADYRIRSRIAGDVDDPHTHSLVSLTTSPGRGL